MLQLHQRSRPPAGFYMSWGLPSKLSNDPSILCSHPKSQHTNTDHPSRNTQIRIRHKTRHKAKLTTETKTVTVGITQRFCQSDQIIWHVGGYSSCLLAQALYALMSLHWVPPNSRSNLQSPKAFLCSLVVETMLTGAKALGLSEVLFFAFGFGFFFFWHSPQYHQAILRVPRQGALAELSTNQK